MEGGEDWKVVKVVKWIAGKDKRRQRRAVSAEAKLKWIVK